MSTPGFCSPFLVETWRQEKSFDVLTNYLQHLGCRLIFIQIGVSALHLKSLLATQINVECQLVIPPYATNKATGSANIIILLYGWL